MVDIESRRGRLESLLSVESHSKISRCDDNFVWFRRQNKASSDILMGHRSSRRKFEVEATIQISDEEK